MANTTGLILSGGGARAAYQVGVLAAIAQMRRAARLALGDAPETAQQRANLSGNPFPIISGTSAGGTRRRGPDPRARAHPTSKLRAPPSHRMAQRDRRTRGRCPRQRDRLGARPAFYLGAQPPFRI